MRVAELKEPSRHDSASQHASTAIELRCPACKATALDSVCRQCGFSFEIDRGIVNALPAGRSSHYAQFIADYEQIRDAEGRGSERAAFYLNLPFRDITGKHDDQWQIRSRSYFCLVSRVLPTIPAGARVLDLGAGNCWLSFRMARLGYEPTAVDLLTNERDGLVAAEHYRRRLPALFARFRAEFHNLPFQESQFDLAIFNASFHYAEDGEAALREAFRCIRPGGSVIICDTPWYSSAISGERMVSERRAQFLQQHGTASASISSMEYLTDDRLGALATTLNIQWKTYVPDYGMRWALRPLLAKLRHRREPARFRIYAARKMPA
jgi:SAM-dependent methyltransferase